MDPKLTADELRAIERFRNRHLQEGCPSDPKRAQWCVNDPCLDAQIILVLDRYANE